MPIHFFNLQIRIRCMHESHRRGIPVRMVRACEHLESQHYIFHWQLLLLGVTLNGNWHRLSPAANYVCCLLLDGELFYRSWWLRWRPRAIAIRNISANACRWNERFFSDLPPRGWAPYALSGVRYAWRECVLGTEAYAGAIMCITTYAGQCYLAGCAAAAAAA